MLLKISREPSKKKAHHDKYYDGFSQNFLSIILCAFNMQLRNFWGWQRCKKNYKIVKIGIIYARDMNDFET